MVFELKMLNIYINILYYEWYWTDKQKFFACLFSTIHNTKVYHVPTLWTSMFKWAVFRDILLPMMGEVSQNVAHLNILVHDAINLLYLLCKRW